MYMQVNGDVAHLEEQESYKGDNIIYEQHFVSVNTLLKQDHLSRFLPFLMSHIASKLHIKL